MAVSEILNTVVKPVNEQIPLVFTSIKDEFQKWLQAGNAKKYSPEVILSCIDRISAYAVSKKIVADSLWNYTNHIAYKSIYCDIMESKFLRITDRNTYRIYSCAGRLHLRFLKEKPFAHKRSDIKADEMKLPAASVPLSPDVISPSVTEMLTHILLSHFINGYRLNSPIELARFRTFFMDDLGEEVSFSDEELTNHIAACGTAFDGKIFAVPPMVKKQIKVLADSCFAEGVQAIFYAEFFSKNENWLYDARIISEEMLVYILREIFPNLSFTRTYFGFMEASINTAIESEILRVWGDHVLLTYTQLAERLQYIPIERIKYALGQNGDFIWNSMETFSHISRFDITDAEQNAIREVAMRECNARGYVSITDLPLEEIKLRNYELSTAAVHNAVYCIGLSDKFDKKGKIITRKGDIFDALIIMKEYCRTIDKCSLDDLLNYEKDLTGEVHRWIPMEAGNTVLIRIDRDTYVADRYVHFNSDAIDEIIGLFMKYDYLPLKSFTTFGAFPDCAQTWNLFLLESYCRRFSQRFRFEAPSVNSRNAGAVIKKTCRLNYTEIMTDAVVNANILLKDTVISQFLYESGYIGRSKTAKIDEIIDKAKALRERRG